jgi:DNA-binding transcriptional ArsR family regulator
MKDLLSFFHALSDETRLRIVLLLYRCELCVCELCEILCQSQPKISRHLSKLRELGLVDDRREKQWIFYKFSLNETFRGITRMLAENSFSATLQRDFKVYRYPKAPRYV